MVRDAADIIRANLEAVREDIASLAPGRPVSLVCVTKYSSLDHVRLLLDAGADELGENLLPDAADRFSQLFGEGFRFTRHLIGPQQTRKLKLIPNNFDCFQALDRLKVASRLHELLKEAGETLDVLLQVNISHEEQKGGFLPEEVEDVATRIFPELSSLRIRGLMAIPAGPQAFSSASEFERETQKSFGQMRELFDRISASFPAATPFDVLSQGMSQDYKLALAEGSNMIRIGSALFKGLEGK